MSTFLPAGASIEILCCGFVVCRTCKSTVKAKDNSAISAAERQNCSQNLWQLEVERKTAPEKMKISISRCFRCSRCWSGPEGITWSTWAQRRALESMSLRSWKGTQVSNGGNHEVLSSQVWIPETIENLKFLLQKDKLATLAVCMCKGCTRGILQTHTIYEAFCAFICPHPYLDIFASGGSERTSFDLENIHSGYGRHLVVAFYRLHGRLYMYGDLRGSEGRSKVHEPDAGFVTCSDIFQSLYNPCGNQLHFTHTNTHNQFTCTDMHG